MKAKKTTWTLFELCTMEQDFNKFMGDDDITT